MFQGDWHYNEEAFKRTAFQLLAMDRMERNIEGWNNDISALLMVSD
jgi:hypothetical protein